MDQPSPRLLQDTDSPATTGRFRPYASTKHRVTRGRYITSNDRRGYIPVYEYPLNGQWIMMDIDDGYILWTGIWKALGNAKADIVKMLESQPDLAPQLRRVRGGYLKIQGTWMPYEVALRLARRVAWTIREDLIPLFGPTFPATCLAPDQPGYGQILGNQPGKRRGRRAAVPLPLMASLTTPQPSDSDKTPGDGGQQTRQPGATSLPPRSAVAAEERHRRLLPPSQIAGPSGARHDELRDEARYSREMSTTARYLRAGARSHLSGYGATGHSPSPLASQSFYRTYMHTISDGAHHFGATTGPVRESPTDVVMHNVRDRFSPYQNAVHSRHRSGMASVSAHRRPSPVDLPPLTIPSQPHCGSIDDNGVNNRNSVLRQGNSAPHMSMPQSQADAGEMITLPPINVHSPGDLALHTPRRRSQGSSGYSLPPISALSNLPLPWSDSSPNRFDSAAVLRRLAEDDDELEGLRRSSFASAGDAERSHRYLDDDMIDTPTQEQLSRRRRSLSEPLLQPDMSSKRPASGLGAPESHTKSTYDASTRLVRGDSVTNPTSANYQGASNSNAWVASEADVDGHFFPRLRTQRTGEQNHALAGQIKEQSMDGEGESPVMPSERPAHPLYSQSGVSGMHPMRYTSVEPSYRLDSDSPHSLEGPSSASYQESQRYPIDKLPDNNFHSSPPRR